MRYSLDTRHKISFKRFKTLIAWGVETDYYEHAVILPCEKGNLNFTTICQRLQGDKLQNPLPPTNHKLTV